MFLVSQGGQIFIVRDGTIQDSPFLDQRDFTNSESFERGLLGLAFHPNFADNGTFFVDYTRINGDIVIARYQVSADDPDLADRRSYQEIMVIPEPYANHNGGMIAFGPDGYLYIGLGDGGSANDPHDNGQTLQTALGSILRIDVDNTQDDKAYAIPEDNPFVDNASAIKEIWAYGLRNPWRFSFDTATGDLYIADVGQGQIEEVNVEPANSEGGLNYGWAAYEGSSRFKPNLIQGDMVFPFAEYDHGQGCSVTGGYVYHGENLPELDGTYFFGDYCSGRVWTLQATEGGNWNTDLFLNTGFSISSFGQDAAGELYLVDLQGGVYQLVRDEE
jgi:glucose/arabinose dehydrogenase